MPLRPGDRLTLSTNPSIKVKDFTNLHPFASISREVLEGDTLESMTADMVPILRTSLRKAASVELALVCAAVNSVYKDPLLADLETTLENEIENAFPAPKVEPSPTHQPAGGSTIRRIRRI